MAEMSITAITLYMYIYISLPFLELSMLLDIQQQGIEARVHDIILRDLSVLDEENVTRTAAAYWL